MKDCFVIMPIGSVRTSRVYLRRYEHIIQPAVEGLVVDGKRLYRCVRADFVKDPGLIVDDVIRRLRSADLVVADLTGLSPNVFYELGRRHEVGGDTILIALRGTMLPFDVCGHRVFFYEDHVGGETEAIPQIQAMIRSVAMPMSGPEKAQAVGAWLGKTQRKGMRARRTRKPEPEPEAD
jgi:hypothetical protein